VRGSLATHGVVVVEGLIPGEACEELQDELMEWLKQEGQWGRLYYVCIYHNVIRV
jgi:hypothetical protein